MPDLSRTQTASRSAFLELQEELKLVRDGYEFLDEKRILIAAELLRQRASYRAAYAAFMALCEKASNALPGAAADQGLGGLQLRPVPEFPDARLEVSERPYVGLTMLEASFTAGAARESRLPVRRSPEASNCIAAFREVLDAAAPIAAMAINLRRLIHEYRRTERRVRALENVVLPEIKNDLTVMDEHLSLNEQEEVIRVRSLRSK